ncbi:YcxB family protein [Paraferrimonas sp. SM1919]|uniref:YcxB family protein n=1 Tax=Paraferrimonas sp. SM1919 TaxID=2662263 RepID=UPI0013D7FF30|nr:YcxB family protein [Paraferrimonas sp. SM1919]
MFEFEFKLDQKYLEQCFDESLPYTKSDKNRYIFAGTVFSVGMLLLLFAGQYGHTAFILMGLACVELLSIRFKRTWWLWRQKMGKSYRTTVTLTIDEDGVASQTVHGKQRLTWSDIIKVEQTNQGFLLFKEKGAPFFIASEHINQQASDYLANK